MTFEKIKRVYSHSAIILLDTVLLLLLLNAVLGIAIWIRHHSDPSPNPLIRYGKARLLQGYPDAPEADVLGMLHETWEVGLKEEYEALTEFKEAPYRGRYVNVDPAGFRASKPQGPWPPDPANFNVFVFGGSTTFGYGVSDGETISSRIQELLSKTSTRRVFVYNFGRGSYFSTQELMLYYSLLTKGRVPQVAVFFDGLNDFASPIGELAGTADLKSLVKECGWVDGGGSLRSFLIHTPMGRVAGWLRRRLEGRRPEPVSERYTEDELARLCSRWLTNKKLIEKLSEMFGVRPLFVWQPVPTYRYDYQHYHLLRDLGVEPLKWGAATRFAYPLMARHRADLEQGKNFLWLADMQEGRRENLYVDEYHYTAAFMKEIAARICGFLREKGFPVGAMAN